MPDFLDRLRQPRPLLLDAAMGTEIDRRGVATRLPLWSAWGLIDAPEVVRAVHEDHLRAGAEVLTTNTFRTHRRSLSLAGMGDRAAELSALAVRLAREAVHDVAPARHVWIAGSVAPLEDCYSPQLTPPDETLLREHALQAAHLVAAGVDLIKVETMPTVREASAAAAVAVGTGRPVLVGFTCGRDGRLLSGETPRHAAAALEPLGVAALMVNCTPADALHVPLAELLAATTLPVGAYGNVGHAEQECGWNATDVIDAEAYADLADAWVAAGARLVGACCGTRPEHLAAVARRLARR